MMSEMKKITVLGSSGVGKSTFARRLGAVLGVKVFHLDTLFWQPGWTEPDPNEFERAVRRIIEGNAWIIEGNYSRALDRRLEASDTIIYLSSSRWRCAFNFLRRCWFERSRPDLPAGCREPVFNRGMIAHLRIILQYPKVKGPLHLKTVRTYRGMKFVYELDGRRQTDMFIEDVKATLKRTAR